MNTLVIGDIHGCFTELQDLLDQAGLADDDRVIALGDIVDRGPASVQVLEFFSQSPNRISLMGNHERKHVRGARREVKLALSQIISRAEFGADYPLALERMAALPLYVELPEAVLAHGYLEPGVPLDQQLAVVLCGTMSGDHHLRQNYAQPWYELYDGEKPVIVGHHDHLRNGQPFIYQERVYCLDTSCVHGGRLTALLLPAFKIISVPSRAGYWRAARRSYAHAHPAAPAAPRRPTLPEGWDEQGEHTLAELAALAQAECQRILAELNAAPGFSTAPPRQQAKAYAAAVGAEMPWAALLHHARRGAIDPDAARRLFKSKAEAQELLERVGRSV